MKKILLLVLFLFRLNIRQCIYFLGVIKLQDTYENYVGRIIQNERVRRGLTIYDVSAGICSASVYVKLESGDYAGGIHILRALCQRLGINSDRCGTYLAKAEYDEMMDRLYILEDIREGRLDKAWAGVEKYRTTYKDIPLNNQFIMFIRGRLAELDGEREKALELYGEALNITMSEYQQLERIPCITIYEAYMMLDAARVSAELGNEQTAYKMYMLLLRYCGNCNAESWNTVCIYPKTVCDMVDFIGIDNMSTREAGEMLRHCISALDILRETERLHYIRPLLRNIIELGKREKSSDYSIKGYIELLECLNKLFKKYGHERELFEWYPYYVDCGFCCVNELIEERRCMRGMSIEELAGTTQSARNVQRIIKGQVSPSYKTSKELLDKLGLKGVLRSDVIVADNIEAYKLWDKLLMHVEMCDFKHAEYVLTCLQSKLDSSIEINHVVLEYFNIWLEMLQDETKLQKNVYKLEKLLPFKISEIGKYKYIIKHEGIVLSTYIVFMDILKEYDSIPSYENMTLWIADEFSKRKFASIFELLSLRYANFYGNIGDYLKSDQIAGEGIEIELECERMSSLNTLLYCIAWNNGEQQKATENDIQFCKWAYEIAKFKEDSIRMSIYRRWMQR